jgi:hypothetical protein
MRITVRALVVVGLSVLAGLLVGGPTSRTESAPAGPDGGWQALLRKRLPLYGHRNWVVVADSAYPLQSRAGVETVATGAGQLEVVTSVLDQLARTKHLRPAVYLDAELPFVAEKDARGIKEYRAALKKVLGARKAESLGHEKIIDRLDRAAEKFNVLVLKTTMTLPYTSVFLELGCGYWGDAAEQRLREAIRAGGDGR